MPYERRITLSFWVNKFTKRRTGKKTAIRIVVYVVPIDKNWEESIEQTYRPLEKSPIKHIVDSVKLTIGLESEKSKFGNS